MKTEIKTRNAIIKGAKITTERCLSAWLDLDYGGMGQGFGGFVLYMPPSENRNRDDSDQPNYAGHFIHRCIEIAGVEEWSKMIGKTVRVKCSYNKVHAIGHIVKDDWFDPTIEFAQLKSGSYSHHG